MDPESRQISVPSGAKILIGAPAHPMPKARSHEIAQMVAGINGILEAHLPQFFIVGVSERPAQVLFVSLDESANKDSVLGRIGDGLIRVLPKGEYLDVWPIDHNDSILVEVRQAGCEIFRSTPRKPWWKFW